MDPINIIQVSLLSKFFNESNQLLTNPYIIICIFIYLCYKMLPYAIHDHIVNSITDFILNEDISIIMIPYHTKSYTSFGSQTSINKVLYSNRFHAINYYIKKHHMNKLFSLTEILNFENSRFLEGESEFILLPKDRQKIKICEKENIFFEIVLEKNIEDNSDSDKSKVKTNQTNKYIYKLTKKGKKSIEVLNLFLKQIEEEYQKEILNNKTQMVFEYKKSQKDDNDKQIYIFNETPFNTNKSFENIFFEEKQNYIDFIGPFVQGKGESETEKKYRKLGNPFKAAILLYGDPGCGKSSLIKATIKYTGRHCVLVPWSKINTCDDLVSLFRPIKTNNKTYNQNELIIVFEDFDANKNDVIKIRDGLKTKKSSQKKSEDDPWKEKVNAFISTSCKLDDELTLEYILNVLDGIVELYNTIVFFTTNDIDIIDPALKRAGRIDKILKLERATRPIIKEMIAYRFSVPIKSLNMKLINKIPEYKFAYADISQICDSSKTVDECLRKILLL